MITRPRIRPTRGAVWAGVALLAGLALRLPSPPAAESARPWIDAALALQGLDGGGSRRETDRHFLVSVPLAAAQNAGFALSKAVGGAEGRGAWIRGSERFSRGFLWFVWIAAAAAAAIGAAGIAPARWKQGVLFAAGCVAISISGTGRLDAWLPAAALFLCALRAERLPPRLLLLGGAFSLHPLALVAGLLLLLGDRTDRIALAGAALVYIALEPARLADPTLVPAQVADALARAGWPGIGDGPVARGLAALWGPGPACAAAAMAAVALARRERRARLAAAFAILFWIAPSLFGSRRPEAIGFASAGALAAGAWGLEWMRGRGGWGRRGAWLLAVAAAATVAAGTARFHAARGERAASARETAIAVASLVGSGAVVAADAYAALPDSAASFRLPANAETPEMWDFAYWPGWYGAFSHWILSARARDAIETDPSAYPFGVALLRALEHRADRLGSFGGTTGRPAVEVYRLRAGSPWLEAKIEDLWGSAEVERPAPLFLNDLAFFLIEEGKIEAAIPLLRVGLRWDEKDARLWNNLGTALLIRGEAQEAGKVFGEGLKRVPDALDLRYGLGRAYLAAGVAGRAETELAIVVTRRPGDAAAHYELARAAAAMNHWPLVVRSLETYLSLEPDPPNRPQIEDGLREARRRAEAGR